MSKYTMTANLAEARIDALYEEVIGKIKDGKMFGVPIELTNIKHLVVASYLIANYESTVVHMKDLKITKEIV